MKKPPTLHLQTALSRALRELLRQFEIRSALSEPVDICLAGGMAVHLYSGTRLTADVDAIFSARIYVPNDLVVKVKLGDGLDGIVYIDTGFNPSWALLHENHRRDALPVDLGLSMLRVSVLSPIDLAVSKIGRLDGIDRGDIELLVRLGLTTAQAIEERAMSAMQFLVGGHAMTRARITEAVALARAASVGVQG